MKIISGGQTGVDRAALDAALKSAIDVGGWCPENRMAEDGTIPEKYPLQVLKNAGYRQRTKRNVVDSDGTAIIYFACPEGGTELTIDFCKNEQKPYVLIDAEDLTIARAAEKISLFIKQYNISILNVAGPRASGEPRAYDFSKKVILAVIACL